MISNQYPPDFLGGDAVFCRTLSEGLVDDGWDVDVLTNPYAYSFVTGKEIIEKEEYRLNGVNVRFADYNFVKLLMNNIGYVTSNHDELNKIEEMDPDVIHLHNFSSFGIKFLKKLRMRIDVPIVMTVHDNWLICPFRYRYAEDCRKNCFGCKYNRYKLPISFPREYVDYIDKLVFPSKFYQKLFLDFFGGGLPSNEVIYNFTFDWKQRFDFVKKDRIKKKLGIPNGKKVVLYVGHLKREKGVDRLIDASERFKDCFFLLVGEDRDNLMEGRSLENVKHLGFLPSFSKKLYSLYWISDLFILPTLWENCPLTVLEAMCFGLPVFASDVGGVPELVKDGVNGGTFPVDKISKLDELLRKFLDEHDLKSMGEVSRAIWEKRFNIEKGVKDYLNTY